MIGGRDFIIPVSSGAAAMELALSAAKGLWPAAVFEDVDTGESTERYLDLDLQNHHEILIYRDREAARQWEELGADESLVGTLIHLLPSPSNLTIVVDSSPTPEMFSYVTSVDLELRRGRLSKSSVQ